MTIIKYIITILISVFLINCEATDEPTDDTLTSEQLIGMWESQSWTMTASVTTNQDAIFLDEESPGTGSINVTGALTATLKYLDIYEDDRNIMEIEVNNGHDDVNIYYSINYTDDGNLYGTGLHYYDDENYYWFYNDNPNASEVIHDGYTITINDQLTSIDYNWDTYSNDTLVVNISGSLTGATISASANQKTVVETDTYTNEVYEHVYVSFLDGGSIESDQEIDCELISDEYECGWNGCEWSDTDNSCGEFTLSCSDLSEDVCYQYYYICSWNWSNGQCYNSSDNWGEDESETWSLDGGNLTVITTYTNSYYDGDNTTIIDTTTFQVLLSDNTLTLTQSEEFCDSNSYYSYYYEYMCEYYYPEYSEEECNALCYDIMAEDIYGLDGDMIVSMDQTITIVLTGVETLSRTLNHTQLIHFINKAYRYKLTKGMANKWQNK